MRQQTTQTKAGEAEAAQGATPNPPRLCGFGGKRWGRCSQTMLDRAETSPSLAASRSFPSFRLISLLAAAAPKKKKKKETLGGNKGK